MGAEDRIGVIEWGSGDERFEELPFRLGQGILTLDVEAVAEARQQLVDDWTKKHAGTG
jgi:hypothetical protein